MYQKAIKVLGLPEASQTAEIAGELGRGFSERDKLGLANSGLKFASIYAEFCLGWIWRQWLLGSPIVGIQKTVRTFVERGLELRKQSRSYDFLPQHDLFLLHCAIFASDEIQLNQVLESVADSGGDKEQRPLDNGELYAAAWCGMLKYWALGEEAKAIEQSRIIWGSRRDDRIFAAPKPLVTPWLKKDWKSFADQQEIEFAKLWNRARKGRWSIRSETDAEVVMTTNGFRIGHMWCWAHCGLGLLAYRRSIEVVTDPFWFPAHALKVAEVKDCPTGAHEGSG